MTESELAQLLKANPELRIDEPRFRQMVEGDGGNATFPTQTVIRASNAANPVAKMSEHELQRMVVEECDRRAVLRPQYGLLYANVNGQYRKGQRPEPGLRPGIPDLFLPVARAADETFPAYHGLYLELKIRPNKPDAAQLEWIHRLRMEGYACTVIWDSFEAAMECIEWYIEGEAT